MGASPEQTTEERKTVNLNAQRKVALGITAEGEDFPDEQVLTIVDGLVSQAAAGRALRDARRAECLRVATLAECGNKDGAQLDPALAKLINAADGDDLEGLITLYTSKAAALFTVTCTKCGTTGLKTRSSVEDTTGQPPVDNKPRAPRRLNSVF
jgi:hypothetical protein